MMRTPLIILVTVLGSSVALAFAAHRWTNTASRRVPQLLEVMWTQRTGPTSVLFKGQSAASMREELESFGEEALPYLRDGLSNGTSRVRIISAISLGKLRDRESIPALKKAIDSDDNLLQLCAVEALGEIGGRRVVEFLISMFDDAYRYDSLHVWVVRALARTKDENAIPLLSRLVNDERPSISPIVREASAKALQWIQAAQDVAPH